MTGVQAVSGEGVWTVPGEDGDAEWHRESVAMLGQAGGVSVLYVHRTGDVVRVPTGNLTLVHDP